ncbi:MAG TPA: hypothetical protein VHN20_10860, partial [Beijerinckiaceae bacterium]|nr:hypothetical protein [Beijerinckiaceae bacterium]
MDRRGAIEEAIAALGGDPGFAAFVKGGAGVLVWSVDGDRLFWTSPAAAPLRAVIAEHDGAVRPGFPARARLRALGQGLAPATGLRLERLRFDTGGLDAPVTCACRRITLSSGEEALLTAIAGSVPKVSAAVPPADIVDIGQAAPPEDERDPLARLQGRGTVRFLWQTDASGRFIAHSDALAEVVGEAGAALTGRTWPEVVGDLVLDPSGRIADSFARRETWSGETVHWRIAGTDHAVAVDFAGMPSFDRARQFVGFRGFGLCRTDMLSGWPSSAPPAASTPEAAQPDVEAVAPDPGAALAEVPHGLVEPVPPEPAGATAQVPHRLVEATEPAATAAEVPPGLVEPASPEPVAAVAEVPPGLVEPAPPAAIAAASELPAGFVREPDLPAASATDVHAVASAPSEPVGSIAEVLPGVVEPARSVSEDVAASLPAATAVPPSVPAAAPMSERSRASDAAAQTARHAGEERPTPRAAVPITGLRAHVAAHLGATPVPLRPRDDPGSKRPEPAPAANDHGDLAAAVQPPEPKRLPFLSSEERSAFREIARSLGAR